MSESMIKTRDSFAVTSQKLRDLGFVLFFCNPLITRGFRSLLWGTRYAYLGYTITAVIIYSCVVFAFMIDRSGFPADFPVLLTLIVLFFAGSYLIHPEYEFWYRRSYYGVYDYILRPDNGLYAYFFVRLINEPRRILKLLKVSGWIMYPYYLYLLLIALQRGYWINTGRHGEAIQMSYDLSFGYDVVFFTLVFLYFALNYKRVTDFAMAVGGMVMILLGGSRGPLICILVFVVLTILIRIQKSENRVIYSILVIGAGAAVLVLRQALVNLLMAIARLSNSSSRTVKMLLEGEIADDNGRVEIWNAAVQMIKDKPWGYGGLGTRHVIYYIHDVGHCHQLFLEILVDFGVFAGGVIILYLVVRAVTIVFGNTDEYWRGLYLVFLCRAMQLMLSGTFWHVFSFWACLGIDMCLICERQKQLKETAVHHKYLK